MPVRKQGDFSLVNCFTDFLYIKHSISCITNVIFSLQALILTQYQLGLPDEMFKLDF